MQLHVSSERIDTADTLVLFLSEEDELIKGSALPEKTFEAMKARGDFSGKYKECVLVFEKKQRILLIGLGKITEIDTEKLRISASVAMAKLKSFKNASQVMLEMPEGLKASDQEALVEGLLLSAYSFTAYKKDENSVKDIYLLFASKTLEESLGRLIKVQKGVDLARDLVNLNAETVTPSRLVSEALDLSTHYPKIKTTVFRKTELEKMGAGLILAVSRGATDEPALITLEYQGAENPQEEPIAIVGKGITYDTGGLNLKPTGSMETMKCDMSGAATVLGLLKTVAELKLKQNIVGVIATCENAIGPLSYKPGDVQKSLSGKTVEVNNTDAEGRLVLADAVTYVQRQMKVKSIIDLATLTGAVLMALGEEAAGLFTRSKKLEERLLKAADYTGEKLWPLPLYDEFKDQLKSSIADMKNSGKRLAGSSVGALFIEAFIDEGTEWAHLDIAGVAFLSEPKTYHSTLATGYGVRLLLNFLDP